MTAVELRPHQTVHPSRSPRPRSKPSAEACPCWTPATLPSRHAGTDVYIDHLGGVKRLPRIGRLSYSVITRAELVAGANSENEANARRLLAGMEELPVDRRIAERAGLLRGELPLRMHDALIAATTLVHSLTLHTKTPATSSGSNPTTALMSSASRRF